MALLKIRLLPDSVLREKSVPVTEFTPAVKNLLDDMLDTMYHAVGVGLAAPQIGILQRVIVMDVSPRESLSRQPIRMINPEIIAASAELSPYEEGCLSIPEMVGDVVRPAEVTVRYHDVEGKTHQLNAHGLLATCVQHEIDHLDGKLFIDYLSPLKRNLLLRRYNKARAAALKDS